MTDDEFARDPLTAIYRELILVEAAALRAEQHLVSSPARVPDARDAVVSTIELVRPMLTLLRRSTL